MTTVSHKPTILQIIPELGPGGAEQGCIDVAAAIVAAGGRALVATQGGSRIGDLLRHKGEVIEMPVKSKNPLTILANIGRLKRLIRSEKIDLVHARSRAPAWSAYFACKSLGIPFVTTCHAPYNFKGEMKRKYNAIMARGDRVIAISEFVVQYLRDNYNVEPAKIRLIHRGADINKFHPAMVSTQRVANLMTEWRVPDGMPVVLLPGRLTRWKGQHLLLEALARLGRKDVFTLLVGSDQGRITYRLELEQAIADLGLEGQVRIVEHCTDMPAAYMLASVIAAPSLDPEGFGRIAIEAQAMGRPIVASDHGGSKETIVRGETGWLVPPGDAQALANAMGQALDLTDEQRAELARRSIFHIREHFTKERMCQQTLAVYGELLRK